MVKLFMCLATHAIQKEFVVMGWAYMPRVKNLLLCSLVTSMEK